MKYLRILQNQEFSLIKITIELSDCTEDFLRPSHQELKKYSAELQLISPVRP